MISARQLARAYDLSVASLWRGETTNNSLIAWLGRYRVADLLPEPRMVPEAVSLLGGGGSGIRWYTSPTAVIGFATGHPAVCYRVPIDTDLPQPAAPQTPIISLDLDPATLS